MFTFRVEIEYTTGSESIDLTAKDSIAVLPLLAKTLRAKERIRGYRPIISLTIVGASEKPAEVPTHAEGESVYAIARKGRGYEPATVVNPS